LIDSYGIASPDAMLVDLPVTWRSLVLVLGVAWCELECTTDPADAAAILTDRPDTYFNEAAELFITQHTEVDAALVDVDDEVLSHADQALLPVPDIIGNAQTTLQQPQQVDARTSGVLIRAQDLRLDGAVWWAMVDAWRRSQPVVLVDEADDSQLER